MSYRENPKNVIDVLTLREAFRRSLDEAGKIELSAQIESFTVLDLSSALSFAASVDEVQFGAHEYDIFGSFILICLFGLRKFCAWFTDIAD